MISEIDILLSKYVEKHLVDNLGPDAIRKIKNRLADNGYSLTESIQLFYPFYTVLKEFFGDGSSGMLQKIFDNIYEFKKKTRNIIIIKDKNFSDLILETYGNNDKKTILQIIANSSMSISEILDKANIPKSSGYKIINALINDGFLTMINEKTKNSNGNKVSAYKSTISAIDIKIKNSLIEIEVKFPEINIKKSHILALSLGMKSIQSH